MRKRLLKMLQVNLFFLLLIIIVVRVKGDIFNNNESEQSRREFLCNRDTNDEFQRTQIGLIISPLTSKNMVREIEIYWKNGNYSRGDVISLYDRVPNVDFEPIFTMSINTPDGIRKTGIQADLLPSWNLTFVRQCLTYHVALLRDGVIIKTNCLETQPTWMADRKELLEPLTMRNIFLPGTHDSAAYTVYGNPKINHIIKGYVITQDVDVLSQLIHGIRYLDIRVGYYAHKREKWWANHDVVPLTPLRNIIEQVKTFLNNTDEIVIFDIQEFPVGFGGNITIHQKLVDFLESEFSYYFIPNMYEWSSPLSRIWGSGRKLIIGYDDHRIVPLYESIWPCVTHQWGNVRTVKDLYDYLNRIETNGLSTRSKSNPRSAMAEMTPNFWDVIFNRLGGLRRMADAVNFNVTHWYDTLWENTANIVAVDFFRSSGIIEVAIDWNERRNVKC